jgi:tetratricopeptide (TPR) repeat protein
MMDSAETRRMLQHGQRLAQAGRMADAWAVLAPLRAAIDGDGQALRLYTLVAQNAGRSDAAIDALERICVLEQEPEQILGALADTLGRAGRHAEAYERWSRLIVKRPDAMDAYLNCSIMADRAGKYGDAVAVADAGLQRAPGHVRLLAAKASAQKNGGHLAQALTTFEAAVAAQPDRALTHYHRAVALRAAARFDEACEAYRRAEALGLKGAEFHAHYAAAELEAGHVDEAADRYVRVLNDAPGHDESMRALTRLAIEFRGGRDAFAHYARIAAARKSAGSWLDYQQALLANKRFEEAGAVGREAMASLGHDPILERGTLFAEGMTGDAATAFDALESHPAPVRDDQAGLLVRAQLALRAGRPEVCAALCEAFNRRAASDQSGWALLGVAWRLLGDPREEWLCDYDRLVRTVDVPSLKGDSAADYARTVAAALDPHHRTRFAPGNQSLRDGTQTSGDLFSRLDPAIQEFRDAVVLAAQGAIAELPTDNDHPFLSRIPQELSFSGSWSVRLQGGGGQHIPHFHSEGWMSSAYYARLPESDAETHRQHQGWIEFGRPPAMFALDLAPRRVVEPCEGRLVLFPSYLWHGTVPFAPGRGDRLTAAFDFQPA